jgi:triosephosphate isomerase
MRPRIVAGNWKMNTTRDTGVQLARAIVAGLGAEDRVQVVVCPPFPHLTVVGEALAGSRVALGAQNCYFQPKGAFTGEVSPAMLIDVGCRYVLIGHSERRHVLHEPDGDVNRKVHAALAAGLTTILCVGETLQERQEGWIGHVFYRQVASALAGLSPQELARLVIAYEPVWAIGTGHTATPEQAQEAHAFIRAFIQKTFGENVAANLPILYGGSVKADNAAQLFRQPDVDGGLIGGASLEADQFLAIVRAAIPSPG